MLSPFPALQQSCSPSGSSQNILRVTRKAELVMKPFTDGGRSRAWVRLTSSTRHHSAGATFPGGKIQEEWQILLRGGLMSHVTAVEDSGHPAADPQSCSHSHCSWVQISSSEHIPRATLGSAVGGTRGEASPVGICTFQCLKKIRKSTE